MIAAADLTNKKYVEINATVYGKGEEDAGCSIKFETKEVGDSYATDLDLAVMEVAAQGTNGETVVGKTISWLHTLTAGEKSNGLQIQITGTATTSASRIGIISNKQVVIKLMS